MHFKYEVVFPTVVFLEQIHDSHLQDLSSSNFLDKETDYTAQQRR